MPRENEWDSKVFQCCKGGATNCILGFFCYQILIGLNAHRLKESFLLCFCPYQGQLLIRSKLRAEKNIDGSLIQDCLLVHFCAPCTAVQEANEIERVYNREPKKEQPSN
ncbi:Placenta-specific gene 8 protein-like [Oopsacas minuta]|uniref:Placenta-specific gene 8 protein-like n=1 Tax=Oopsacas minuta TaxID=111878 RepID=A0AAV7K9L5_9METZ|nr:Placenta-specific gene 8 protein-like [Oopsacas minuta]